MNSDNLDPEMQRLYELCQEATARAVEAVELDREANARAVETSDASTSALAEAQRQLKLWEDAARARGIDPDLCPDFPPRTFHLAERYWPESMVGPGTVKTDLNILEDRGMNDEGPYVDLKLTWQGENEQPEFWQVQWTHYLGFLGANLANYLFRYCPVPRETMATLLESLTPEWRSYFAQEGNYGQG